MIFFALLLAGAAGRVTVIEETLRLAPGEVRAATLSLRQQPAVIDIRFQTEETREAVSVALRAPQAGERGAQRGFVRLVREQPSGSIRYPARTPGDYEVVIENPSRGRRPATVRLRVELDFEQAGLLRPATLPPERQRLVVILSLLFFVAVAGWSARRLREAIERRRRDEQFPQF